MLDETSPVATAEKSKDQEKANALIEKGTEVMGKVLDSVNSWEERGEGSWKRGKEGYQYVRGLVNSDDQSSVIFELRSYEEWSRIKHPVFLGPDDINRLELVVVPVSDPATVDVIDDVRRSPDRETFSVRTRTTPEGAHERLEYQYRRGEEPPVTVKRDDPFTSPQSEAGFNTSLGRFAEAAQKIRTGLETGK